MTYKQHAIVVSWQMAHYEFGMWQRMFALMVSKLWIDIMPLSIFNSYPLNI